MTNLLASTAAQGAWQLCMGGIDKTGRMEEGNRDGKAGMVNGKKDNKGRRERKREERRGGGGEGTDYKRNRGRGREGGGRERERRGGGGHLGVSMI